MYKCANVTFNNCNFTNINVDSLIYRPSFDNLYYDEANWEWKVIENQSGTCYFDEDGLVLVNKNNGISSDENILIGTLKYNVPSCSAFFFTK